MKSQVARKLIRLNRRFYERFAFEFASSRRALPPGVLRALASLGPARSLLDVGCGDARVSRALLSGQIENHIAAYLGVDFSRGLLARPADPDTSLPHGFDLLEIDLTDKRWARSPGLERLARGGGSGFDAAACFAVLFHIPGPRRRLQLLRNVNDLLAPGGELTLSVWQFLHVPRIRKKIVDWNELELDEGDLDPGDLLLDWWSGGRGLRYVHHFTPEELEEVCRQAGFEEVERWVSDGETGDMSLFLRLRKPEAVS